MSLKPLLQVIIREFNKFKDPKSDAFGLAYTFALVVLFFVSGILGILNYFIIKVFLFSGIAMLLFYIILIMDKNKNHPE